MNYQRIYDEIISNAKLRGLNKATHNAKDALNEAKSKYGNVDGCYWCMQQYHTR
jgi:hypothetical protein